jgi:cytochrome c556
MRRVLSAVVLSILAVGLPAAQAPKGWRFRADRSASASDPDAPGAIKFVTMGSGFHATNPQAAVYWNPANVAAGSYSVKGTFTLLAPSNHTNYYGLVFGGRDLEGPGQSYAYFLVAQDGTWLVKRREGDAVTHTVVPRTPSPAITTPDASGRSINELEVRVAPSAIEFVVNGAVVNRWRDAGRVVKPDGIYGLRVNHFLDVLVDGLAVTRSAPAGPQRPAPATVTMTATVERRVSATAFTLGGTPDAAGGATLVIAPALQRPVERDAELTVFGEMAAFDPAEIARRAKDYRLDVPTDVAAQYRGRPVLIATSVLDQQMVDLTQRLPPPMTADEAALSALMKRISPAFAALGQAAGDSTAGAAAQSAGTLSEAFADVEAVWTKRERADAVAWAREARQQSQSIARAAGSGQWDQVKPAIATLGQQCQACHTAYREPFADGSFRIKVAGK